MAPIKPLALTPSASKHRRVMSAATALDLLRFLQSLGVPTWVDGGWGVDALAARFGLPRPPGY